MMFAQANGCVGFLHHFNHRAEVATLRASPQIGGGLFATFHTFIITTRFLSHEYPYGLVYERRLISHLGVDRCRAEDGLGKGRGGNWLATSPRILAIYKGMLPCFFIGLASRLLLSISNALM